MRKLSPSSLARDRCVSCGKQGKLTREHYWPQWLIRRTKTYETGVKWAGGKKINPKAATFPLCRDCNQAFGAELESPVSQIFEQLERGDGLSDNGAELLIRWLWKLEGLAWLMAHPKMNYAPKLTLRDRVLNRLGEIRPHLSLAVSLIHHIDPRYGDAPMGINSRNERNAIFVSGVFSRVALMSLLSEARELVPQHFSVYALNPIAREIDSKLFYPKTGFNDDTEAVGITELASKALDGFHEESARQSQNGITW